MEDFLKYIIPFLIDNKQSFRVDKKEEGESTVIFTIHVAKEDMGKVIGKEGRTIQSIRNLIKILAVKENKRVMVEIAEPEGSTIPATE
ncbi:KH domain-containing protein [Candidatus Gottesmanbacteria bacterium]|nr:KH domain-containing protein [Candidatus Gottesmanbacteria bacterium]